MFTSGQPNQPPTCHHHIKSKPSNFVIVVIAVIGYKITALSAKDTEINRPLLTR
jgi:hypothetical protein